MGIKYSMEVEAENYPVAVMGAGTKGRGIAQVAVMVVIIILYQFR
ncbi:MAG: hypothetical protein CM1200mP28_09640 [Deltaproteobacteria bacterium]|nr:MAG: hypothetical protein CM1200mP28_09640 [Deltaproteobacteria bacterium]